MTYDEWKTTDDTPQPERTDYCPTCLHWDDSCECPCCYEPAD